MAAAELLGRAEELAALERLVERASSRPAGLLFEGEAGIGKTAIWREGIALARDRGFRVLGCEAAPTETPLAFAGLGDLLDELPLEVLKHLPPPQRRALEISLLLVEPNGDVADQRAVSLALLTAIRRIVAVTPLLIAIDNVQWLDGSSARVLAFALRRLGTDPVGLLITRRTDEGGTPELPLDLDRSDEFALATERWTLGPLSLGAIGRLLNQRLGRRISRPTLSQLFRAAGGNPFYALEIARSELERSPAASIQPLQVPEHLSTLVSDRLAALPAATRKTLLVAAALSDPTVELVSRGGGGSLAKAIDAGVVELDGERIRFTNSLLASVLYAQAPSKHKRELHGRLAEITPSAEERARHLALASSDPDADVAAELEAAAERATSRGAPDAAAELYEHAARLTPLEQLDDLQRRRIEAASRYYAAGDLEHARTLAEEMLEELGLGRRRVDALVLLADIVESERLAVDLCQQAVEAAGADKCCLAKANLALARALSIVGDFPGQVEAQREALTHAERCGDSRLLVEALQGVGNVTVLSGGAIDEKIMQRAIEIERERGNLPAFHRPSFWYGMQLYWTDQLEHARSLLYSELERASHEGDPIDRLQILAPLVEIETRIGNWDLAEQMATEGFEQALDIGHEYVIRGLATQKLQLAVLRGRVEEARQRLVEMAVQAERVGDRWEPLILLSLTGFLELSLGNAREAWQALEPALQRQDEIGRDISVAMPLFIIRPNAIETLVALDELQRAELLLNGFEDHVKRTRRPNGLVSLARSQALVAAARGDCDTAVAALARAVKAHEALPDPFELGRTMLVLGTVERRRKRRRDAREALEQAREIFAGLGARLWMEKVEAELERVGGRRGGSGLTPTEQRVAELVATGQSNKEVAAQLFMSVRTVEANLSKIYRKLGIDSRAELAARLQRDEAEAPENG